LIGGIGTRQKMRDTGTVQSFDEALDGNLPAFFLQPVKKIEDCIENRQKK